MRTAHMAQRTWRSAAPGGEFQLKGCPIHGGGAYAFCEACAAGTFCAGGPGGRMASFSQREGPGAPWEPYDPIFSAQIAAAIGSSSH